MPDTEFSLPTIRSDRLLDRFLRYVRVGSAADPDCGDYPSSPGQRDLATRLGEELREMGAESVDVDENSLVWGTIPGTVPGGRDPEGNGSGGTETTSGDVPCIALVAHVDTSPEAPGEDVRPQVVEAYTGGDIELASGDRITPASCPALEKLVGKTLITTDGTTLLGGDDKAGVAIIMELAETLIENPGLRHGPIRVLFTCDEEIGRGTDKIDLKKLAADVAYTLDGGGSGVIDVETFSADAMTVRFLGHNIHPAIAKGRMVNAARAAADFVAALPSDRQTPETTDAREGFLHPHTIRGGVGEATVELILRSFDSRDLDRYADEVLQAAEATVAATPGLRFEVDRRRQYRNMGGGLQRLPESMSLAEQAFSKLGRDSTRAIVRGGTDGSQLTEKGLPTPNLSSGQHNIHSVTEFACLDEMIEAVEHLVVLATLWGEHRR